MNAKVFVSGYVGNVKQRTLDNGVTIISFSIPTETYVKNGDNITEWHNLTLFIRNENQLGYAEKRIVKGNFISVEGTLRYSKKDDVTYTNIYVDKWNGGLPAGEAPKAAAPKAVANDDDFGSAAGDDDLPF